MSDGKALWLDQLTRGIRELAIEIDEGQRARMLEYLVLLEKWNRVFNLTAVRDEALLVPRHLLDSLSVLKLVRGRRILDVGSGAGLPGIPLAIALPGTSITLLDSNGKKTRFLEQCRISLGLGNLQVVRSRVEMHLPGRVYDMIVCRAFSSLVEMIGLTSHLLPPGGRWLAMKGPLQSRELDQVREKGVLFEVRRLLVPEAEGERYAVICHYPETSGMGGGTEVSDGVGRKVRETAAEPVSRQREGGKIG